MLLPWLPILLLRPALQGPVPPAPPKAAVEAKKPAAPLRYKVTPDTVVHLGAVGPKEVRTTLYDLTNTSDRPIAFRVLDLAPGTTASLSSFEKPWAPGETRRFSIVVDPTGWVGYQRRAVKLEPDDAEQPWFLTRIDMTVRPEMSVDALTKNLGEVAPFESPQAVFRFKREGGDPSQIKLVSSLPPYLEGEVSNEGTDSELRITLRPRLLKAGMQAGLETLKVETTAPRESAFTLYLSWKLRHAIQAEPARVIFDSETAHHLSLNLKSRDGKAFRILKAEIEGGGFAVGAFPEGTRPASGAVGSLPKEAAATHRLAVERVAKEEARAVLVLSIEGQDEPLKIPLSYLPPSAPAKPQEEGPQG